MNISPQILHISWTITHVNFSDVFWCSDFVCLLDFIIKVYIIYSKQLWFLLLSVSGKLRPSRVQSVVSSQGSLDSDMLGEASHNTQLTKTHIYITVIIPHGPSALCCVWFRLWWRQQWFWVGRTHYERAGETDAAHAWFLAHHQDSSGQSGGFLSRQVLL